jgi:peptidoglycan/xylan/chitin deacetylase (PgdA/CDA1 family)
MKSRGIITLVFDDGYEKVYENVLPVLKKHKMPGVFALPTNDKTVKQTATSKIKPWFEWMHIKKEGHEIAAHSVSHIDLTNFEQDELKHQLEQPAQQLNTTTLIYPGGAHNDEIVNQAKQYYSAGRTVLKGFENITPSDPMRLHTYNFTKNNFSVTKANLLALWAWLTNSWLIETYHMIDNNNNDLLHTVRTDELNKHLSFIKKLPLPVKTIQQVIKT